MTHSIHASSSKPSRHLPKGVSRRDVLRYTLGGAGLAALGPFGQMLPAAQGAPAGNKIMVVVYLYGGNDGTNMVIPTTLTPYYSRRAGLAIPVGEQLSLTGGPGTSDYTLHPALSKLKADWDLSQVALVNLVGYPSANLSHFVSQDVYSGGVRGDFAAAGIERSGWIARFADLYAPTPMGAVSVGVGRPFDLEGGASNPFMVSSLSSFQYYGDGNYPNNHPHRLEAVRDLLDGFSGTGMAGESAAALQQGHQLADEIQEAVANYTGTGSYVATNGRTYNIHRYLQDVSRLIQHGFETRVFFTGFGGFDTHSNQGQAAGRQSDLFDRLDTALSAFKTDMELFGTWNDVVVVVASEFGRRNYVNGSSGTDHGHGNAFIVHGGAVNGGVYGRDMTDADLNQERLGYDVDFRDIYREIVNDHLGHTASAVFPETQPTNTVLGIV